MFVQIAGFLVMCFGTAGIAWSLEPASMQNFCPVFIENNTGLLAENLYFIAHGLDNRGVPCFLVPENVCRRIIGHRAKNYTGCSLTNGLKIKSLCKSSYLS